MQDPGSWVLSLANPLSADVRRAGSKAAELGRLLQEGLPVPEAYVVSMDAFRAHFPEAAPGVVPDRPELIATLSQSLAEITAEFCPDPAQYVAVRSSALAEDGTDHSFAGQHATYYYVSSANIDKAVVDCWLSLWSGAALAYRTASSIPADRAFGMAVVIQKMIQADRSGVCFSVDPTGAHPDEAVIESSWGLGAALVDGRVSPDRFWLDPQGAIRDRKISRKRLKVAEDLRDPTDQRLEPVPLSQQSRPSISEAEACQIAALARDIARRRDQPQDVEWAFQGKTLFVLQSRPVTLSRTPTPIKVEGRWVLFKPTAENFSGPLTPMTVDLYRRVLPPFGCFIEGRYYVNADLFANLLPLKLDDEQLTDIMLMRQMPKALPLSWSKLLKAAGSAVLGYLAIGTSWHRTAKVPLESLERYARHCEALLADETLDPLETLKKLIYHDHPFRPIGEFAIQANLSSVRYFLLIEFLKRLLGRFAPDFDTARIDILCSGGSAMLSQQMVERIRYLAEIAREDPVLAEAMLDDDLDPQAVLLSLDEAHPFTAEFQRFLGRFGHRAVRELDLMAPRWREDSTAVMGMIRNYLRQDPDNAWQPRIDLHGLRLAAEDELHQALQHAWQRRLVDRLTARIRYYVTLRENTRHYHTLGINTVREKIKHLERQLIHDRRLRCEDDVFFLEYPDIVGLTSGALDWQDVEPLIRARRQRYQRQSQVLPRETFNLNSEIPLLEPEGATLLGDCACPGVAEGIARVIHDPTLGADLNPGEILVAPYTDPAWTPLFPGAGAIVVETGSYLSHAGTVAREYQVPCLVDVRGCTRKIRSGQRLRVNATEGWLEIAE